MDSHTASIFCVRISPSITQHMLVHGGKQTREFQEAFPEALPIGYVHVADDPVAEVRRQIAAHKPRQEA